MDNVFTYRSTKIAALNEDVELYPHQVDAIEFLKKNHKGVIAHGTGMGKTLTSIAAFERLKQDGLANRAIVVVPASLRDNFAGNISKYTDSKYTIYGPKNDKYSTNIDVPSTTPYNIISYDLYRKDPEGIRKRLGADTLIIDESHRARNKNTSTYKQLSDTSKMYSNIVSLTGSLVNNEPSDIVPLLDISHGKGKNPITGRSDFNRRFVAPKPKKRRGLNTRDEFTIVNRKELSNLLKDKVHYVSHRDVERSLPAIEEEVIRTEMTPLQKNLYLYAIESLDPATRRKIERNVPVSQKEMAGIFAYLIKARKVLTDPSKMYDKLEGQDPYEYSPKIKRVVDDLNTHMAESDTNRSVIYGNLVNSQLKAVESALSSRGIEYATFYGTGNEGNSASERQQAVSDYLSGKKRILLVSGAGAEGLDLKGSTMLQMLEGHYNPEKIQQATARVRRMGDTPDKPILIKKYVSVMPRTTVHKIFGPLGVKPQTSIDEYIYTAAKRKDDLNEEFRMSLPRKNYGTLKTASTDMNESNDAVHKKITAGVLAPHLIGSGALGLAVSQGGYKITNVRPDKGAMKNLDSLVKSQYIDDSGEFFKEYIDKGNKLMNSGLKYNGKHISATDFIKGIRSGKLGDALHHIGINPKPWTPDVDAHYSDFSKHKGDAAKRIIVESLGENAATDAANTYKGYRWGAVRDLSGKGYNITPEGIAGRITQTYAKDNNLSPSDAKHLYKNMLASEKSIMGASSNAYRAYNSNIGSAISENNERVLSKLDSIKETMFSRAGIGEKDRLIANLVDNSDDAIAGIIRTKLHNRYRGAVKNNYAHIANGLKGVVKARNAFTGGKVLSSAALAGGILSAGYALNGINDGLPMGKNASINNAWGRTKQGLGWYADAMTGNNTVKRTAQLANDMAERTNMLNSIDDSISTLSKRKPFFFKSRHTNKLNELSAQRANVLGDMDNIASIANKDIKRLGDETFAARSFTGAAGLYGAGVAIPHIQKKRNEMAAAEDMKFTSNIMRYRDGYIDSIAVAKHAFDNNVPTTGNAMPKPHKDTSFMYDFMAGVEPSGAYTFEASRNNRANHGMHRATGAFGGFIGGAAVLPAAIGALAMGVPRYIGAGKSRSVKMITDAAIKPYKGLYYGSRAKREMNNIVSGKGTATKYITKTLKEVPIGNIESQIIGGAKNVDMLNMSGALKGKGFKSNMSMYDVIKNNPDIAKGINKNISYGLGGGIGVIGLSGATNSLSAVSQYNSGLKSKQPQPTQ